MLSKSIVERYISEHGRIRVAIAGAGYMTSGLLNQNSLTDRLEIVAIASRSRDKIVALVEGHGLHDTLILDSVLDIPKQDVDVVIDLTGDVESGARIAYEAIQNGRHILCSAETDSTVGPVLAELAREAGVIFTSMWGDEPGLIKGVYDYAEVLGFDIFAVGKFKGFHDMDANPDSVKPWADLSGQNPVVISSFADGTKLAMEMTVVSNGTGFEPDVTGMNLPRGEFDDVLPMMKLKEDGGILSRSGVIEVIVGPKPGGAVFVLVRTENAEILESFKYYKMGDGPYYMLYYPYHMPGIEMLYGIYEMLILNKSCLEPMGAPVSDVMTIAKRDLKAGNILGDIGYYDYCGIIATVKVASEADALPAGLAKDAVMVRDVAKGEIVRWADVEVRNHDFCVELRQRFDQMVKVASHAE